MDSRALRPVMARWALPVTAGLWAAAPDLDTWLMFSLGIPRNSIFSHRGVFHSPFFLIAAAIFVAWLAAGQYGDSRARWLALMWAVSAVTHPLPPPRRNGGTESSTVAAHIAQAAPADPDFAHFVHTAGGFEKLRVLASHDLVYFQLNEPMGSGGVVYFHLRLIVDPSFLRNDLGSSVRGRILIAIVPFALPWRRL